MIILKVIKKPCFDNNNNNDITTCRFWQKLYIVNKVPVHQDQTFHSWLKTEKKIYISKSGTYFCQSRYTNIIPGTVFPFLAYCGLQHCTFFYYNFGMSLL